MRFEYYQSKKDGKWYWRLRAKNGRIVADGAQGYKEERYVKDAAVRVRHDVRREVCPIMLVAS